ncbi:MAG: hypothetical protein IPM54_21590 [Polyangiaceae bacterium]|nr:hypothetical protein [Polyangiaceae bacterium]
MPTKSKQAVPETASDPPSARSPVVEDPVYEDEHEERIAIQEESRGRYDGIESAFPAVDKKSVEKLEPNAGE